MGHGTQKGVVDSNFEKRVKDLEEKARKMSEHFRDHNTYRPWHTPENVKDPLDVPSLHNKTWDRNNINQLYSEEIVGKAGDESGTDGDAQAMKIQADFMAAEERAFRTRHASMIRCASFAHGRMDGHGKESRGLFSYLLDSVDSLIRLGARKE
ncbi:hypothetical protein EBZ39_04055 [bacterium]|nr:hypothetical protein [bacterium]